MQALTNDAAQAFAAAKESCKDGALPTGVMKISINVLKVLRFTPHLMDSRSQATFTGRENVLGGKSAQACVLEQLKQQAGGAGKFELWVWFRGWTVPCVKVHMWHLFLDNVMDKDHQYLQDGYSSTRFDNLHTMWSSLGTDTDAESDEESATTVKPKAEWLTMLDILVKQTGLAMVADSLTRSAIEKVCDHETGNTVSSKPAAERTKLYSSTLHKVRDVVLAAFKVESEDPAIGCVTPHTVQMAKESDNFRGKENCTANLKNVLREQRAEVVETPSKDGSEQTSTAHLGASGKKSTCRVGEAHATTDCGQQFSLEFVESVSTVRDALDSFDGVQEQHQDLASQVETNAGEVKQHISCVAELTEEVETAQTAAEEAKRTASEEPTQTEKDILAGVEEVVQATQDRLVAEKEELKRGQDTATALQQQQAEVAKAVEDAREKKELALSQHADVVRVAPVAPGQLQLQKHKATAFAHHVVAFASVNEPTADNCVTGLDMQQPLTAQQVAQIESMQLKQSRVDITGASGEEEERFALFCSGRVMQLPVAKIKPVEGTACQEEDWLKSISQMHRTQRPVDAGDTLACNNPKFSIIVVSAVLLARDFQKHTLKEFEGTEGLGNKDAVEAETQRRCDAVKQAFKGMLDCLSSNGRILVHIDPTLSDPMHCQEQRIAAATSSLECYSGNFLFCCDPKEAMHYGTECIRKPRGCLNGKTPNVGKCCADQPIINSMENHARIVVVGHKTAKWNTKLQPQENTSPQGEHGSTRVSWHHQLRVTEPVTAKEVKASFGYGDNKFTGLAAYQWAVVLNDAAVWEHLEQGAPSTADNRPALWLVGEVNGNVVQAAISVLPEEFGVQCHVADTYWYDVQTRIERYLGTRQTTAILAEIVRLGHAPLHYSDWYPPVNLHGETNKTTINRKKDQSQRVWTNDELRPSKAAVQYNAESAGKSWKPIKVLWARFVVEDEENEGAVSKEPAKCSGPPASGENYVCKYTNEEEWVRAEYLVLDAEERGTHRHRTKCCRYYWASHSVMRAKHSKMLNEFLGSVDNHKTQPDLSLHQRVDESKLEELQDAATKEILRGDSRGAKWATQNVVSYNNLFCSPNLEATLRVLGTELAARYAARQGSGHAVTSSWRWAIMKSTADANRNTDEGSSPLEGNYVCWTAADWQTEPWPQTWLTTDGKDYDQMKNYFETIPQQYRKEMESRARQVRLLHNVQCVVLWAASVATLKPLLLLLQSWVSVLVWRCRCWRSWERVLSGLALILDWITRMRMVTERRQPCLPWVRQLALTLASRDL